MPKVSQLLFCNNLEAIPKFDPFLWSTWGSFSVRYGFSNGFIEIVRKRKAAHPNNIIQRAKLLNKMLLSLWAAFEYVPFDIVWFLMGNRFANIQLWIWYCVSVQVAFWYRFVWWNSIQHEHAKRRFWLDSGLSCIAWTFGFAGKSCWAICRRFVAFIGPFYA